MRNFLRRAASLLLALACLASLFSCTGDGAETIRVFAMDTVMRVTLYGAEPSVIQSCRELISGIEAEFDSVSPDGGVYKLNEMSDAADGTVSAKLPADTLAALTEAQHVSALTDGAFDVTVCPVVRLWGFGSGEYRVPEKAEIASALENTGYGKLSLSEGGELSLPAGVKLDLGAIAKGYTAQKLAELAVSKGVVSAMFVLGGNVQTVGMRPDGEKWRVGVLAPDGTDDIIGVISVGSKAVVTSGSYIRRFEADGVIYHHIIDPSTGYPADSGLSSVTVITDNGAYADAMSTALFVLGAARAFELYGILGDFEAVFICTDGRVICTPGIENDFDFTASDEYVYGGTLLAEQ